MRIRTVWPVLAGILVTLSSAQDPQLKEGFPVVLNLPATGPGNAIVTVGNIDGSPDLEIIFRYQTPGGSDTLFGVKANGSLTPSLTGKFNAPLPYVSIGEVSALHPGNELVMPFSRLTDTTTSVGSFNNGRLTGDLLFATVDAALPALLDLDGDGLDDTVYGIPGGQKIWLRTSTGTVWNGFPTGTTFAHRHICIVDLETGGKPEIVSTASGQTIVGLRLDGTSLAGWPVAFTGAKYLETSAVAGDVDGNGTIEVVHLKPLGDSSSPTSAVVLASNGAIIQTITLSGNILTNSSVYPVLADLDNDGSAEIIVQTNSHLNVVRGNGTPFPGWPVPLPGSRGNSTPVVGDLDGDGIQDICGFSINGPSGSHFLYAYSSSGQSINGFPKALPLANASSAAIEDLDRDGRNELVVMRSSSQTIAGLFPAIWAYDLQGKNYGPVLWGQFGGSARHIFRYPVAR